MNINALFGTSNQPVVLDGQTTPISPENGDSIFNQMLKGLTLGEPGDLASILPGIPNKTAFSLALLKILGQQPTEAGLMPDLLEEASTIAAGLPESAVTLTDIMAALQPIVNEDGEGTLPSLFLTDEETSDEPVSKEIDLTGLALLSGTAIIQPPVLPQTAPVAMPSVETITDTTETLISENPVITIAGKVEGEKMKSVVPAHQSEATTTLTGAASANSTPTPQTSFAQTLAGQASTVFEESEVKNPASVVIKASAEPTSQPQAKVTPEAPSPILQPEVFNMPQSPITVEVLSSEAPAQLPEIPALHQLVEKISLMKQDGGTEVRLHLQPESLGQVLIQLHFADGDVSVRMLAETPGTAPDPGSFAPT
ncbi:MAG: hypothetical protein HC875_00370 [Anaerolineales bacterium]|nr:hypothetical protein [Anaerolineales bacterium]